MMIDNHPNKTNASGLHGYQQPPKRCMNWGLLIAVVVCWGLVIGGVCLVYSLVAGGKA